MNKTKIPWVLNPDGSQGYTLNIFTGCFNHTPEGLCLGGNFPCYAFKLANGRLKARYLANTDVAPRYSLPYSRLTYVGDFYDPFYLRFWMDRVERADRILKASRKPLGIFPCDMSDWAADGIPEAWREWLFELIRRYPQHRFYLLTKQPQNLPAFSPFPGHCWVGVTATNDDMFWKSLGWLRKIDAKVKYISIEPLLGQVSSFKFMKGILDWVIIGALTGTKADLLPIHHRTGLMMVKLNGNRWSLQPQIEWVEEVVEACDKAGIPVFLKDNLRPLLFINCELPKWARTPHSLTKLKQEMSAGR